MNIRWPFQKKSTSARILEAIDNGGGSGSGTVRVSVSQAFDLIVVFACIRVISEDVAKLPASLKRQTKADGVEVAFDQPEHIILNRIGKPATDEDDGFTAMEWIEAIVASAALQGYGVAHLNRVGGRVREITPVRRGDWKCERGQWSLLWSSGGWRNVSRSDLMVLRGPQLGTDITQQARQAIDLAIKLDKMTASLVRKSGRPNGILSTEKLDSKDKGDTLVARIKQYFGPSGDGGLMPLDLGALHYIRLSMSPEELQHDTTYGRSVRQICSALRVQPSRVMEQITEHNNASAYQWNIAHVSDTVQPWSKRFKQTFDKDVLGDELVLSGYYCDIELKGLLGGSPKERGDLLLKFRTMGALSPLGVARIEDLPTKGLSDDPAFPLLTNPNPQDKKETDDD